MNAAVSSPNTGGPAHPPRSNPLLRSSSVAPPLPCITPSTETCVMVVSFMIAVPFSLGPLAGGLSPLLRTPRPRSDSAPRISLDAYLVRQLRAIRRATVSGPLRSTSSCAPSADELRDQIDRETPDLSSAHQR